MLSSEQLYEPYGFAFGNNALQLTAISDLHQALHVPKCSHLTILQALWLRNRMIHGEKVSLHVKGTGP